MIEDDGVGYNTAHQAIGLGIQSDVFWVRDPLQLVDYIESTGIFRGKI
ncbi:MAG: hypothetical protein ACJAZM_002136 [Cyclobacteriaceae bacterium]|jgi:hypothetical protein